MLQSIPYYGLLAVESLVGVFGLRLYEEPRHTLIDRVGPVEVRRYAPRVAAVVDCPPMGAAERGDAFRLLFNYIAGTNRRAANPAMNFPVEERDGVLLAMTAPVQTSASRMMFFLPADYDLATAPRPADSRVKIVAVPTETIAVLRFSGIGGDAGARQAQLVAKLSRSKWRPVGVGFMLYYDAPFTLSFLRRNEAAVIVEEAPSGASLRGACVNRLDA